MKFFGLSRSPKFLILILVNEPKKPNRPFFLGVRRRGRRVFLKGNDM